MGHQVQGSKLQKSSALCKQKGPRTMPCWQVLVKGGERRLKAENSIRHQMVENHQSHITEVIKFRNLAVDPNNANGNCHLNSFKIINNPTDLKHLFTWLLESAERCASRVSDKNKMGQAIPFFWLSSRQSHSGPCFVIPF